MGDLSAARPQAQDVADAAGFLAGVVGDEDQRRVHGIQCAVGRLEDGALAGRGGTPG